MVQFPLMNKVNTLPYFDRMNVDRETAAESATCDQEL